MFPFPQRQPGRRPAPGEKEAADRAWSPGSCQRAGCSPGPSEGEDWIPASQRHATRGSTAMESCASPTQPSWAHLTPFGYSDHSGCWGDRGPWVLLHRGEDCLWEMWFVLNGTEFCISKFCDQQSTSNLSRSQFFPSAKWANNSAV